MVSGSRFDLISVMSDNGVVYGCHISFQTLQSFVASQQGQEVQCRAQPAWDHGADRAEMMVPSGNMQRLRHTKSVY